MEETQVLAIVRDFLLSKRLVKTTAALLQELRTKPLIPSIGPPYLCTSPMPHSGPHHARRTCTTDGRAQTVPNPPPPSTRPPLFALPCCLFSPYSDLINTNTTPFNLMATHRNLGSFIERYGARRQQTRLWFCCLMGPHPLSTSPAA